MGEIVPTWFGVFLLEGSKVTSAYPFPADRPALRERMRLRRQGSLAPEEERLLSEHAGETLESRDRRFLARGVSLARRAGEAELRPSDYRVDPAWRRELFLEAAEEDLVAAWDPSVHIEQTVRALGDLDTTLNLLEERLTDWGNRDAPSSEGAGALPLPEPEILEARARLRALHEETKGTRSAFEKAIEEAMPRRAPNLTALLGALLAARMISAAGSLDRLARLPSSTVQVLGAERAFFEHLRGRAPPPKHGLLFLHPAIHGQPKQKRGALARALAGKVSIAARLDAAGGPLHPELGTAFAARAKEIEARPRGRGRNRSLARPRGGATPST